TNMSMKNGVPAHTFALTTAGIAVEVVASHGKCVGPTCSRERTRLKRPTSWSKTKTKNRPTAAPGTTQGASRRARKPALQGTFTTSSASSRPRTKETTTELSENDAVLTSAVRKVRSPASLAKLWSPSNVPPSKSVMRQSKKLT